MVPRWLGIDRMWVNRQVVVGEREISRRRYEPFSRVSHLSTRRPLLPTLIPVQIDRRRPLRFTVWKITLDFWRSFANVGSPVSRLIMNMTRRLNCNAGTVQ